MIKLLKVNMGENHHDLGFGNRFFNNDTKSMRYERKNSLIGLHNNKKLLGIRGHY